MRRAGIGWEARVGKAAQPGLFSRARPPAKPRPDRYEIAPFDFERDGNASVCVPREGVVIPEGLELAIDGDRDAD
jgi:hypothetical protein